MRNNLKEKVNISVVKQFLNNLRCVGQKNQVSQDTKYDFNEKLSDRTRSKLRELEDTYKSEYGISWGGYYSIDRNVSDNVNEISLKDKDEVRLFITHKLNKQYLDYCRANGVKAKGMIVLPEHLPNTYEIYRSHCTNRKVDLVGMINDLMEKYRGENGEIYFTCYEKHISKALKDIKEISLNENSDPEDYSKLLPDYREVFERFKFNEKLVKGMWKYRSDGGRNIEIVEEIISMLIHPKYRANPKVIIKNRWLRRRKDTENFDVRENAINQFSDSYIHTSMHEFGHAVLKERKEVNLGVCDMLYEITKGNEVLSLQDVCYKYGFYEKYKKSEIPRMDPYATKMPPEMRELGHEYYDSAVELLSFYLGEYLLSGVIVKESIVVDLGKYGINDMLEKLLVKIDNKGIRLTASEPMPDVEKIIKQRFNTLCVEMPEVAAMLLTLFRGEFKS